MRATEMNEEIERERKRESESETEKERKRERRMIAEARTTEIETNK